MCKTEKRLLANVKIGLEDLKLHEVIENFTQRQLPDKQMDSLKMFFNTKRK